VNVAPTLVQTPAAEYETAPPGAFASTSNDELYAAVDGACVVTLIVWSAFCAVTVSVCCGAAL